MSKKIQLSLLSVALLSQLHAEQTVTLDTITVSSATKTEQSLQDVTSNIDVITAQEIEEKHYTTVTEAINSVAGINFTSNGGLGTSTSVFVRGFDSKRVLVLIDGVRYNDVTGLSGAPFEHLMIGDVQQIEIIKGAQSGVWGADATAGVINIITKTAKKGLHASANLEYGSFATKKYGASVSYKTDKYYMQVSSKKVDTNGFTAQLPLGDTINQHESDGYRNTTTNVKLGVKLNDTNKIDISHTIVNAYNEYDGFAAPDSYRISRTNDTFSKINFHHVDSFNKLNLYAQVSKFDREYPQEFTKQYIGEVREYGINSKIDYASKDFILVGGDYKSFEHTSDLNKQYNNKALFVTNSNDLSCPLGGSMILTESLRTDRYDKFDNKTTGKVGLKRVINKDLSLSANYGTAYNVPTLYNLYSAFGNPNITPESTKSFDISMAYKQLKVTYFTASTKDLIDFDLVTFKYNNLIGTTKFKGLEAEYTLDITDDLIASVNYTRLNAKNNKGEVLKRRPRDTVKLSVDYYVTDDLHFGLNGEYIGERYDKDNKQGAQTGRYTLVNLVSNYDVNKNLSIYAKIDNLFDKYYQVVDGYATAPLSMYAGMNLKF